MPLTIDYVGHTDAGAGLSPERQPVPNACPQSAERCRGAVCSASFRGWPEERVTLRFSTRSLGWSDEAELQVWCCPPFEGKLADSRHHTLDITLWGRSDLETDFGGIRCEASRRGDARVRLLPAGTDGFWRWQEWGHALRLKLAPSYLSRLADAVCSTPRVELRPDPGAEDGAIRHLLLSLGSETQKGHPFGRLFFDSLVQGVALHLLRQYRE